MEKEAATFSVMTAPRSRSCKPASQRGAGRSAGVTYHFRHIVPALQAQFAPEILQRSIVADDPPSRWLAVLTRASTRLGIPFLVAPKARLGFGSKQSFDVDSARCL